MVAPKVPHRQWERCRGYMQLQMGTTTIDARKLPFIEQVGRIARGENEDTWRERYDDVRDDPDVMLKNWSRRTQIEIVPEARSRPHRPEIEEDMYDRLLDSISREAPRVPVRKIAFSDALSLLLENVEKYYNSFGVGLVEVDPESAKDSSLTVRKP